MMILEALATIPYFNFHFFLHLLIFLQFRDPSYVLWAKHLQFELIFRRA